MRRRWLDNTLVGTSWTLVRQSDVLDQVYGVAASNYVGDHFGRLIWMDLASGQSQVQYYRSVGEKSDVSAFGKWSGTEGSIRWHAEAQGRRVLYQTSGRDNDYSVIDVQDTLMFFNPQSGIDMDPFGQGPGLRKCRRGQPRACAFRLPGFPPDTPLNPERLTDVEAGATFRGEKWAVRATAYNMQYTDQLVATGQLNDVGNVVRVNVDDSYRRGFEIEAGVQVTPTLRVDANATLSQNKIALSRKPFTTTTKTSRMSTSSSTKGPTLPCHPTPWAWVC